MILDFVANHTALDHPWVKERPEFYIHGTEADLAAEPYNYCRVETRCGTRILAYGRDPYYHGWPDTLQLNFRHPALYDAMSQQLLQIAKMCDGVRCDLAMLMLPDIFYGKTWGTRSEPADGALASDRAFWPDAIALVRRHYRDFVFIAEVYWDKEWEMQQQGFDYTYDKRLYDRLVQQNAEAVRSHLRGGNVDFQRKLVRFLENHDERRAASVFPPEVHRAAAVVAFLTPGLRLLHEGQLEGRKVKVSIHLKRRPVEVADLSVREFYSRLLPCIARPEVQNGRWQLLECLPEWDANPSWKQFIAFCWVGENGNRLLAAVNYAPHRGQCFVKLPFPDLRGRSFCLQDLLGTEKYQREGNALVERGLYLNMRAWSYSVFEFVEQPAEIPGLKLCRTQRGHKGMINRIAWSPDGHQLASGSNDRTIRIWNIETGKESHVNENRQVLAIAWSWDGKRLASGGGDSCIGIWKTEPFGKIRSLAGHSDWVNSVAWLPATPEVPTPKALVSTSADFTVRLWDTESGEHRILGKHQNNVFCVACSPDGHTIASASADNTVRLWDITTGQPGPVLEGHTDQVLCVTWAPDGHTIASASTDNTVRVWEAETGRLITILEAHTDDVRAVSLSFDGRLLASKGADAAVRIWRYDNWQIVAELHEQNGDAWLSGLAFHPQRPVLATLGEFDTVIRIWDLEVESLLAASSLTPRLQYTSAKIVLVGEAGVGKSSLATRLVEDSLTLLF